MKLIWWKTGSVVIQYSSKSLKGNAVSCSKLLKSFTAYIKQIAIFKPSVSQNKRLSKPTPAKTSSQREKAIHFTSNDWEQISDTARAIFEERCPAPIKRAFMDYMNVTIASLKEGSSNANSKEGNLLAVSQKFQDPPATPSQIKLAFTKASTALANAIDNFSKETNRANSSKKRKVNTKPIERCEVCGTALKWVASVQSCDECGAALCDKMSCSADH